MKRHLSIVLFILLALPFTMHADDLCMDGTLLFREDFGGNSPDDPRIGQTPVNGMTYNQLLDDYFGIMRSGSYLVTKQGYCNGDTSMTNLPQNRNSQWHLQDDHTYPNDNTRGYLLEIDGRGDHSAFYSTTIDGLCEGSKLTFSAYVANVLTWGMYVGSPGRYAYPRLKFVLTDPITNDELATYDTGDIPFDSAFIGDYSCWKQSVEWRLVGMNFTVPTGKNRVKLTIYNNTTGTTGNDFAIDDIEVRLCAPPVSIDGYSEICLNETAALTANFTNDGTFAEPLAYKWWFSADSISWETLDETSNVLSISNVQKADSGWYQVAVAGSGEIEYLRCRAISEPFLLNVKECTPPEQVTVTIISPDSVCPNDPYTFEVEIENEELLQTPIEYQWWYRSPEQPNIWKKVSGGTQRDLKIASFKTQHVGWYKLMVAGPGQIDIEQNRVESEEHYVTFKKCEPDLCLDGMLLYRDDFGGNDPDDPRVGTDPVPGMAYMQLLSDKFGGMGSGRYLVTKEGYCNGDTAALRNRYGYVPEWGSQWMLQDDHTYLNDRTRGYFVEIDGAGGNTPFYSTTIDGLCSGSKLTFSAYVVNVHFFLQVQKFYRDGYNYVYPRMKFVLKNPETGEILAEQSTGDIQPDVTKVHNIHLRESADWQLVGMEFTVPPGVESIQMYIYNDAVNGTGNDFAMDDIEIHLCTPPVTIEGEAEVCENTPTTLTANFSNDDTFAEPLEYKWWFSADSLTWTEKPDFIGKDIVINAVQKTDSGWYKVAVSGTGNIESINCRTISEPFLLNVIECEPPYYIVEQTLSACHEDSVLYRDRKYAAPGFYCDTMVVADATDTIYHLTVTDNRSFKDVSLSIMSGSLIPPIGVITESGVYQYTFTNAAGCDSIVTWYVTVTKRCIEPHEEHYLIGPGQTYSWAGQTLSEAGEYPDTIPHQTNEECDTVVRLHLDILTVEQMDLESGCSKDEQMMLHLQLSHPVDLVRITFTDEAKKAGLRDSIVYFYAQQGDISIPHRRVHPGRFICEIALIHDTAVLYTASFAFTLFYPASVLEQAWNDVVAVLTRNYNGGYNFIAFQWYENGEPLPGENHSYLYKPLIMGGEYSALLTESDGTQAMTCPLIATHQEDISLYPTVVGPRRMLRCYVSEEAELILYDALGRVVARYNLPPGETSILAPGATGVYIACIVTRSDPKERPYKLIVR